LERLVLRAQAAPSRGLIDGQVALEILGELGVVVLESAPARRVEPRPAALPFGPVRRGLQRGEEAGENLRGALAPARRAERLVERALQTSEPGVRFAPARAGGRRRANPGIRREPIGKLGARGGRGDDESDEETDGFLIGRAPRARR
jgi:hypothetical protein